MAHNQIYTKLEKGKNMKHELYELRQKQSLPLNAKITLTKQRIREWYEHWNGNIYVSISGKDSTVLLDIVRKIYPDIPAVFVDTGLEYPEVRKLALSHKNVIKLEPKKPFWKVVRDEGYPIIGKEASECICNTRKHLVGGGTTSITENSLDLESMPQRVQRIFGVLKKKGSPDRSNFNMEKWKPLVDMPFKISNKCCDVMKKGPCKKFNHKNKMHPMTAEMAVESRLRTQEWLNNGCNGFDMKEPKSMPMSFWTEQDVLQYIKKYNVEIPSIYGEIINDTGLIDGFEQLSFADIPCKLKTTGCKRTGCIYCGFGVHLEKGKTRFQQLKKTHPKLYDYCINGGEFNKKGLWQPNQKGLGLGFVFDSINKIYGQNFIRYK